MGICLLVGACGHCCSMGAASSSFTVGDYAARQGHATLMKTRAKCGGLKRNANQPVCHFLANSTIARPVGATCSCGGNMCTCFYRWCCRGCLGDPQGKTQVKLYAAKIHPGTRVNSCPTRCLVWAEAFSASDCVQAGSHRGCSERSSSLVAVSFNSTGCVQTRS
jgi:hypothetical protein